MTVLFSFKNCIKLVSSICIASFFLCLCSCNKNSTPLMTLRKSRLQQKHEPFALSKEYLIELHADGVYYYMDEPVTFEQLKKKLPAKLNKTQIKVYNSSQVPQKHSAQLINWLYKTGFKNVIVENKS